jgi:queuine tRNA-ribosyltransferase
MPVGTHATVKTLSPDELAAHGARCLLANAYHLSTSPGAELIEQLGGLHAFMGWRGPILTDSGGFQVMSLGRMRAVGDDGVRFRSAPDGSEQFFSPEHVAHVQGLLGSDIAMVLDECVAYPCSWEVAQAAVIRTTRWAARARAVAGRAGQLTFGIVQGGAYADLRRRSALDLANLGFAGYGIGGLSVGEPAQVTREMLDVVVPVLPIQAPRYLMGVGSPGDLVAYVDGGVDLFDSVLPTRLGRHGVAFTFEGSINLRRARHARADVPIEAACRCATCAHHSRAYLHHLHRSGEPVFARLVSLHNIALLIQVADYIREAIRDGSFPRRRDEWRAKLGGDGKRATADTAD